MILHNHEEKYLKFINEDPYEKVHLKFCKMILGVKKTVQHRVEGRNGKFPPIYRYLFFYGVIIAQIGQITSI